MAKVVDADFSMEDMWREAGARFKKRTGMNVNLKPPKTLNDCVSEMDRMREPAEPAPPNKKEKAKQYGIVVFGSPSTICFNALSILLDIPETLKAFRDEVDGLFETLEPSLSVFRIYEKMDQFNEVEPELKQAIHRVMISFVDICALTIELRDSDRWHKLKSKMKLVILQDDSGVQGEIQKFKTLTEAHHSVQSTQTLKVVLDTRSDLTNYLNAESERSQQMATDVASLKAANDKQNSEDTRRKHMENIKNKLGIDDSFYKSAKDMCDKPRKECVTSTALWFRDHVEFQAWAERDEKESHSLCILTGAPNTGKSAVLSSMMHHLRSKYEASARQSPRTLIAGYFFSGATGKDNQDQRPIATALKCIAIQLAEQDGAYAKSLSQACDSKSENSSFFRDATCEDLWEFLRVGSPKGNIAHYLVLDGLGGLPDDTSDKREQKEQLIRIIKRSAKSSMRVLLSARRDTLWVQDLPLHAGISIEDQNESDIQRYIENDLKVKDIFQDPDDEALRKRIQETLTQQVNGNFNKVKAALEKVRAVVAADGPETEIDKILKESDMNEKQISQTVITQLEEKLTGAEIDELNELLAWVVCARRYLTVEQLDAALILRFQKRGTMRLKKKLEGKYSGVLKLGRNGLVVTVDDMDDLLIKTRDKPRSVDDTPTFTATITITKGDLRSFQAFMWSLSQKVDSMSRDTFGFQQMAEQKNVKNNIHVNEVDSHFEILQRTFNILASQPTKESKLLGDYLLNYLPQHLEQLLEKATGFDELTPSQKQEIGEGLFSLFVSGDAIERHWDIAQDLIWFRDSFEVEVFRKWLKDPSVTSHLGRLDREWLKEVEASPNPNRALLEKIMKTVAHQWLCESKWNASEAFRWLKGYLDMRPPPEVKETVITDDSASVASYQSTIPPRPMVTVVEVTDWCTEFLKITSDDGKVLMKERLGETYTEEEEYTDAIAAFNEAISLKSPSWKCLAGLAKALAGDSQYEKACEEMEKALEILSEEETSENKAILGENYRSLAGWYDERSQHKRAIEYTKRSIELVPDYHKAYYELLDLYIFNDLEEDVLKCMDELVEIEHNPDRKGLFGRVVSEMANGPRFDVRFGRFFRVIAKDSKVLNFMFQEMDNRIEQERKDDMSFDLAKFTTYKGIALYLYGEDEATRSQLALECWNEGNSPDSGPWGWHPMQRLSLTWTCAYHISRAKALHGSKEAETHVNDADELVRKEGSFRITGAKAYLASYYAKVMNDQSSSREVLKPSLECALDMLSDDIEDNDWEGYFHLGCVLMHSGDDLNALSAFSLLFPQPRKGNVISWMLDFEEGPTKVLSEKLVEKMEKEAPDEYLGDQMDFFLDHIRDILPRDDESDTDSEKHETASNVSSRHDAPVPQVDGDTDQNDTADQNETADQNDSADEDRKSIASEKTGLDDSTSQKETSDQEESTVKEETRSQDNTPHQDHTDQQDYATDVSTASNASNAEVKDMTDTSLPAINTDIKEHKFSESGATTPISPVAPLSEEDKAAYKQIQAKIEEWSDTRKYSVFYFWCLGPCERRWDFENGMNACKFCFDTGFCDECLDKLKKGEPILPSIEVRCNKDHEWLHLPKWNRQRYMDALTKKVTVGGELNDGNQRVGGEVIPVSEWMDQMRDEWGIVKKEESENGEKDEEKSEDGEKDDEEKPKESEEKENEDYEKGESENKDDKAENEAHDEEPRLEADDSSN